MKRILCMIALVAFGVICINYSFGTYENIIDKQNVKINELRAAKTELEQQIITLQSINGELSEKIESQTLNELHLASSK